MNKAGTLSTIAVPSIIAMMNPFSGMSSYFPSNIDYSNLISAIQIEEPSNVDINVNELRDIFFTEEDIFNEVTGFISNLIEHVQTIDPKYINELRTELLNIL